MEDVEKGDELNFFTVLSGFSLLVINRVYHVDVNPFIYYTLL